MVKGNIDDFHGTIKISNIKKVVKMQHTDIDESNHKGFKGQYVILGDYDFIENENQKHSGNFSGSFKSNFFIDKDNKWYYDDIVNYADDYNNNQFVGTWTPFNSKVSKRCNWGDYRIPNSGDFDIGAGDFSPTKGEGWQTVREQWSQNETKKAKAVASEKAKWWK